jgi:hypothetical protein
MGLYLWVWIDVSKLKMTSKTPISRGPLLENPRSELVGFLEKVFSFELVVLSVLFLCWSC